MALNEERSSFLAESNIRNFARNAKNQVIYCMDMQEMGCICREINSSIIDLNSSIIDL